MSPSHVLEPTYEKLKRRLMEGAWPPGEKLEALRLADDFGVSMTPVRDCLNRLVGERLVEMKPGEGYRVVRITEQALRDMLDTNMMLLENALIAWAAGAPSLEAQISGTTYADKVASVFDLVLSRSGNAVLRDSVRLLSGRLHIVRMLDEKLFADTARELKEIERLAAQGASSLLSSLKAYHDRRRRHISNSIRLMQ